MDIWIIINIIIYIIVFLIIYKLYNIKKKIINPKGDDITFIDNKKVCYRYKKIYVKC